MERITKKTHILVCYVLPLSSLLLLSRYCLAFVSLLSRFCLASVLLLSCYCLASVSLSPFFRLSSVFLPSFITEPSSSHLRRYKFASHNKAINLFISEIYKKATQLTSVVTSPASSVASCLLDVASQVDISSITSVRE